MRFGRLVRQWLPPTFLAVTALVAWQAANGADFDPISVQDESYPLTLQTPMLSARRAPITLRAPISDALIGPNIDRIAERSPSQQTCLSVRNGGRILGRPQEVAGGLVPASNQKLLTTYAALGMLGPDFRFTTRVMTPVPLTDGVLDGDLYLVGDGDPFLITETWLDQYERVNGRSHTQLEALADAVVAAGVTEITGSVLGDESLYDDVRYGPWDSRLIEQKQSGPMSALTVNEGFSDWPETFRDSFRSRSETDNPPLNAASVFGQLLQERGVTVTGGPGVGVTPASGVEIASLSSPPLLEIATHINSYSSNIGAELVLKRLGLLDSGQGTTEAGAAAVTKYLTERGVPMDDVLIFDGSGLDEDDRVTCAALVTILASAGPETPFGSTLSVAGERGSLASRFVDSPAEGKVLAKTGTLRGVRALAGYVRSAVPTDQDAYVSFAYIINDQNLIVESEVLPLQDQFVAALTGYPGGPTVAELSPRAPQPG